VVICWTYEISLNVMQTVVVVDTFAVKISIEDSHKGISLCVISGRV
jgi:hypothetical protein